MIYRIIVPNATPYIFIVKKDKKRINTIKTIEIIGRGGASFHFLSLNKVPAYSAKWRHCHTQDEQL